MSARGKGVRRRKAAATGRRYSGVGFYVEGRLFACPGVGQGVAERELGQACAFAARLAVEYGRPVSVEFCLAPGAAEVWFWYGPDGPLDRISGFIRRDLGGAATRVAG